MNTLYVTLDNLIADQVNPYIVIAVVWSLPPAFGFGPQVYEAVEQWDD